MSRPLSLSLSLILSGLAIFIFVLFKEIHKHYSLCKSNDNNVYTLCGLLQILELYSCWK